MAIVTSKTAGDFIARTKFPPRPTRKSGITNAPPVALGSVEAQTLVVGSGLVVAGKAVPRQTREDLVSIFILPPGHDELERRLKARAQDSDAVVARRMAKAASEISHWPEYDYVIVNRDIDHQFKICSRDEKTDVIANFLKRQQDNRGVIFCRTKAGAIILGKQLTTKGFPVDVLQGDLTQKERDTVMRSFKKERTQFLIATDVAARGIDVEGLSFVIHHQLPEQVEYYTHRSGRTARAGKKGISITLIEPRERPKITKLENDLGLSFSEVH